MTLHSPIEWLEGGHTWNPTGGCAPAGEGCRNCYAARLAGTRLKKTAKYGGLTKVVDRVLGNRMSGRQVFDGTVRLFEDVLEAPLHWRKPQRVFVDSMSDLFHEDVPDAFIDRVFAVMALCPQHQFIVLTKRGERMAEYFAAIGKSAVMARVIHHMQDIRRLRCEGVETLAVWPIPNVVLGVSASVQREADDLIPWLLRTPAAVRIASLEPLLGEIDLGHVPFIGGDPRHKQDALTGEALMYGEGLKGGSDVTVRIYKPRLPRLDGVIVGGESGPGARPMHPDWARGVRDQCVAAGVAFYFKQWGEFLPGNQSSKSEKNFPVKDRSKSLRAADGTILDRVGKKFAGRLLDGRAWNEWPKPLSPALSPQTEKGSTATAGAKP